MCLWQLAVQVALVLAKVARTDYPAEWPSLFEDLISRMQSNSVLTTRRIYLTLHHIMKELASKRLAVDQRNFAEVTDSFGRRAMCAAHFTAMFAGMSDTCHS